MEPDVTLDPPRNYMGTVCCNCCEPLQPIGACDPPDVPSYPVYELTNGEEALKINAVLDRVFRLAPLRHLNEDELEENIPLCLNCANILSQLDVFFQEFDRVRRFDSYLSAKIDKLDEVIQSGIAALKLQLQEINSEAVTGTVLENEVIKTEPEDPPGVAIPPGPWVVLKRLKPNEVSERCPVEPEIDKPDVSVDQDSDVNFDPDFEADCKEEEVDDNWSPSDTLKNRRASKRHLSKPEIDPEETPGSSNKTRRHSTPLKTAAKLRRHKQRKRITSAVSQTSESRKVIEEAEPQVDLQSSDLMPSKASKRIPSKQKTKTATAAGKSRTKQNKSDKSQNKVKEIMHAGKRGRPRKSEAGEGSHTKVYGRYEGFYRRKLVHPCPCQYCLLDFDIESDRVEHVRETHCDKNYSVVCPPCGKVFSSETGIKNHKPRCGRIPPQYHMPPFICETCGKEFQSWESVLVHKKTHSDERPYACDECDHRTKHASALISHKKLVHTFTEVQCPDCNATLKNQFYLEQHLTRMHTERGKEMHKEALRRGAERDRKRRQERAAGQTTICSDCNIDFQTIIRLRRHRIEVHGDVRKKWQCEQCGKGFYDSRTFNRHIESVHTDERPYVCDLCGTRYKGMNNLLTHKQRVHTEGGQAKYNEYNRANYVRIKNLKKELAKARMAVERPEGAVSEASQENLSSLPTTLE